MYCRYCRESDDQQDRINGWEPFDTWDAIARHVEVCHEPAQQREIEARVAARQADRARLRRRLVGDQAA